jgi:uncharacterized protein
MLTWYEAASPAKIVCILAHGAGAGQSHPSIVKRATAWAQRGISVATFNFSYMENKKRAPDRPPQLEARWRDALSEAESKKCFIVAAGKSMGGRIATQVSAQGEPRIGALLTLGYPLHPPGEPEKLRVAHFPKIRVPWLLVQGERDTFGSPAEVSPHLAVISPAPLLHPVSHADHSLSVLKKSGVVQGDLDRMLDDLIVAWIKRVAA